MIIHTQIYNLTLSVSFSVFKLDYKNYLAFINHRSHIRGNSNSYGVQTAEEPIYNWRTVIVTTFPRRLSSLGNKHVSYLYQPSLGVC